MKDQKVAILHYSAPPVIGGVEAVIKAHLGEFLRSGYPCTVIAGRGDRRALPSGANLIQIPEIDSQHPEIIKICQELDAGRVPSSYELMETRIKDLLGPVLEQFDHLIVHNIFTKHFNLPLTGALHRLLDQGAIKNGIAWCHDFTWTSPNSRSKVYPDYPWDLLRTQRSDCEYVVVSQERQDTLAGLFSCALDQVKVIYNGVDPQQTLGLSEQSSRLIDQLGLLKSDLNILMPVRVTQAKNIEFALEVLAALKNSGADPRLVLTGPPDPHESESMNYYQSLRDLREELGLSENMHFIFESGPDPAQPFFIDESVVGDLYRVSDVMFMPSHREGFGMPVLEAGLAGIPILSRAVPAAQELAKEQATIFSADADAKEVAALLTKMLDHSGIADLRRRVRKGYTWQAIFDEKIQPLLDKEETS